MTTSTSRTVGIDLAAAPERTAAAVLEWSPECARVVALALPADDATLREVCAGADRIGVDAPIGWPSAFVDFVTAHRAHRTPPGLGLDQRGARRPLTLRVTDDYVARTTGLTPLSVSADLIANVAFRAAGLLADLGVDDRVNGRAVEAYPAAALHHWGLAHRRYKGAANAVALAELVSALERAAPWLDLGEHRALCTRRDDAFDAVITAMIARAAQLDATVSPPPDLDRSVIADEGWIHIPRCTLADLVGTDT
ncbi:DUF429 domain-containing protein [Gordonia jinhuaensis]|uniref:DUF429 domain-containing protein n=1 Tax=Gordonia jinhuaensis TaxID=1517702 RepID=A0A916T4J0_9ACTN|nr:DUF429 domain-containing protein [Gordonia jinhuaensis]GGB27849.1 hypothetical protein GCM10011489_15050 [Gordonia jinhuaensis]